MQQAVKEAIYDALLITVYADAVVQTEEVHGLLEAVDKLRHGESALLAEALAGDPETEVKSSFGRVVPAVRAAGSPVAVMRSLAGDLAVLSRTERREVVAAIEHVMKSDQDVHIQERSVYAAFKKAMNLDGWFSGLLKKFRGNYAEQCPQCGSELLKNTCVFELDGYSGRNDITWAQAQSGKGSKRPKGGRKKCYCWRCEECEHEWEVIK